MSLQQKNILKVVSLFSFLILLVFVSHEINLRQEKQQMVSENWQSLLDPNRKIAAQSDSRDLSWEKQLAHSIGKKDFGRETASIGKSPSQKFELTLGQLAGKYRIVTQPDSEGRVFVRELEFVEGIESSSNPLLVPSLSDFLNKNSYLFGLDESFLELKSSDSITASYQAKTLDGRGAGVRLEKDKSGRLLRLSVQVE